MNFDKKITNFKGVLMNGFLIQNPQFITTLALLFEKVYIPNNLEFVIEFAKHYQIMNTLDESIVKLNFESEDKDNFDNPFKELNEEQIKTAKTYLFFAQQFCADNHELFPNIFKTDLLKDGDLFNVELIKKGENREKNLYKVSFKPMHLSLGGLENIASELDDNGVPILISRFNLSNFNKGNKSISNKGIAAILAMKTIEMLIPSFKGVAPEIILEARDKLSNQLPLFWSAMLKFSIEAKQIIDTTDNIEDGLKECQNIVDSTIRPALIDLNRKLELERKNWFYRILTPVAKNIKLIVGKPSLTAQDLISTSLSLSANVALDYVSHKRKIQELQNEAGFTYMIELSKLLGNQ